MNNSNMKTFYTSDLHFNHHNLYARGVRPFSCAEECQELIRDNFNKEVRAKDKLYILGDLALNTPYDDLAEYLNSINGIKIVILGNHDNPKVLDRLKQDEIIANWHYWKGCHDHGVDVFMTHFVPFEAHVGPVPRLNLHGHVHGLIKDVMKCPLLHDVGVDANDYKPFTLDSLNVAEINDIRLGNIECPYKQAGMLCTVCSKFVYMKASRRAGIDTIRGNNQCLEK